MKNAFIISFLFVMVVACSDQNFLPIEDKIILEMGETKNIPKDLRTLHFFLETEKEYPCINYTIISSGEKMDNKIKIWIDGVREEEICLTATGPAKTTIGFGGLKEEVYEFDFKVKSTKVCGTLTITSDEYQLDLESNEVIEVVNPVLVREK